MNGTNANNVEERFDGGDEVLDYFETGIVLNTARLADLAPILNLSALAREAGVNAQTLQSKIRRRTPLTGEEAKRLVCALKKHHIATVA